MYGGAAGFRDMTLLESALARTRQHYASGSPILIELAALYKAGIVRSHPLVDGNKRAGFVIGVLFFGLNGFGLRAKGEDATQAVLNLAAGDLDEAGYAVRLEGNVERRPRR